LNNKGEALRLQGKYDEAIKVYIKAIELDPNFGMAWGNTGIILVIQGRYNEAIAAFDKDIELDPEVPDGEIHFYRGIALEKVGRMTEANNASKRR